MDLIGEFIFTGYIIVHKGGWIAIFIVVVVYEYGPILEGAINEIKRNTLYFEVAEYCETAAVRNENLEQMKKKWNSSLYSE